LTGRAPRGNAGRRCLLLTEEREPVSFLIFVKFVVQVVGRDHNQQDRCGQS
jgi:hypothetical protein